MSSWCKLISTYHFLRVIIAAGSFDKDPENPHRIAFTDTVPSESNWSCNTFVDFMQGSALTDDGIPRQEWVVFHHSGEPMIPPWNSETTVKAKREILLHFLRISYGVEFLDSHYICLLMPGPSHGHWDHVSSSTIQEDH